MAQHDYVIANGTGAAVRSDLNNALAAIVSQNSGATEPTTTYAYMPWADTGSSPPVFKIRNAANNGWITLYQLDGEWSTIALENGTAGAPSLYFKDSGTDTGFYSPGADQVAVTTAGVQQLLVDSYGVNTSGGGVFRGGVSSYAVNGGIIQFSSPYTDIRACRSGGNYAGMRFFTQGANSSGAQAERMSITTEGLVGIGTTSPTHQLTVHNASTTSGTVEANRFSVRDNYGSATGLGNGFISPSSNNLAIVTNSTERMRLDSSGRLLVGTSSHLTNVLIKGDLGSSAATTPQQQFALATNSYSNGLSITNYSASGYGSVLSLNTSLSNTLGTNALVTDTVGVGTISFNGNDGTNFVPCAEIKAAIDGTSGAGDMPGRIVLSTTADGSSSPTERMRITNGGLLKVTTGTQTTRYTNTVDHCVIQDKANWLVAFENTNANPNGLLITYNNTDPNGTGNDFLYCEGVGTQRASIRSNGGLANYSANNVNLSDINVKKDISPAAGTWDCLKAWEIVNFHYKDQPDDADLNLGVIAQQVAESCPEVITIFQEAKEATEDQPAQEERLGVKDQQMMWMAIKALQEAQLRIETLEAEVAALKAQ